MINSPGEFISYFFGRFDGPLHFRFYAQPLMAILLATRDGWRDARLGKPLFTRTVFADRSLRRQLALDGWKRISRVFFIAVAIDFIYQMIVKKGFEPVEALWVAVLLAIVPYALVRGPVNRLVRHWYRKAPLRTAPPAPGDGSR
jgi:hypothetical protein